MLSHRTVHMGFPSSNIFLSFCSTYLQRLLGHRQHRGNLSRQRVLPHGEKDDTADDSLSRDEAIDIDFKALSQQLAMSGRYANKHGIAFLLKMCLRFEL